MILSDNATEFARRAGAITIDPHDPDEQGGNSYDVHLSKHFMTHAEPVGEMVRLRDHSSGMSRGADFLAQSGDSFLHEFGFNGVTLDVRFPPKEYRFEIPEDGYLLLPGVLYLASTVEFSETLDHLPYLDGKCFGSGTLVWMWDRTLRPVQDIVAGDLVLGVDGKPKRVSEIHSGLDQMFRIDQSKGMSYTVNRRHELVLKCGDSTENQKFPVGHVALVQAGRFSELAIATRKHVYGFRREAKFNADGWRSPIDPYMLGVWLGDGSSDGAALTINNNDAELLAYVREQFPLASFYQYKPGALTIRLSTSPRSGRRTNTFLDSLRDLDLIDNKHIPRMFETAPLGVRMQLLAGLLDTDGSPNHCGWEITTKFDALREGIVFLANSVGLFASVTDKVVDGDLYYRINISGDVGDIPVRLSRKRDRLQEPKIVGRADSRITVTPVGVGAYYGFTLEDGEPDDALFFLQDFTVVHNSSVARLGMGIHLTAGRGDVGFANFWTMEITVVHPLVVIPGMPVGQLTYHEVKGTVSKNYATKAGAKYQGRDPRPQASRMSKNFPLTKPVTP